MILDSDADTGVNMAKNETQANMNKQEDEGNIRIKIIASREKYIHLTLPLPPLGGFLHLLLLHRVIRLPR